MGRLNAHKIIFIVLMIRVSKAVDPANVTTEHITIEIGSTLTYGCLEETIEEYQEDSQHSWIREGNLSFPNGRTVQNSRVLEINNIGREDEGVYLCYSGESLATKLLVSVEYSPIMLPLISLSRTNESTLSIGCVAEGFPPPLIYWSWSELEKNNLTEAFFRREMTLFDEILSSLVMKPAENTDNMNQTESYEEIQLKLSSRFVASILTFRNISEEIPTAIRCTGNNARGSSEVAMSLSGTIPTNLIAERKGSYRVFILSMLPPLHIAFYIVCALACKSGAAEHSPWSVAKEGWNDPDEEEHN